jgi:hypothetical protein
MKERLCPAVWKLCTFNTKKIKPKTIGCSLWRAMFHLIPQAAKPLNCQWLTDIKIQQVFEPTFHVKSGFYELILRLHNLHEKLRLESGRIKYDKIQTGYYKTHLKKTK